MKFKFKTGCGSKEDSSVWTVCYDSEKDLYSAEIRFRDVTGFWRDLYEISKEIFEQVGTSKDDDGFSERLIEDYGRLLCCIHKISWADKSEKVTIIDPAYKELCAWAL